MTNNVCMSRSINIWWRSYSHCRTDQPVARCGLEVIPNSIAKYWPTSRSMQPRGYSQPHCRADQAEGPMQPSLEDNLVVKLFGTPLPKLANYEIRCWSAFNYKPWYSLIMWGWDAEPHGAWGVDCNSCVHSCAAFFLSFHVSATQPGASLTCYSPRHVSSVRNTSQIAPLRAHSFTIMRFERLGIRHSAGPCGHS